MPPDPATALLMDSRVRLSPRAEQIDTSRDAPLWRTELPSGAPLWVATGHDAAELVLTHPCARRRLAGLSEQWRGHIVNHHPPQAPRIVSHLINSDPPLHARLRKIPAKGLAAARTGRRTGWIEGIAADLADGLAAEIGREGAADIVTGYAFPLAMTVITEIIGIPERFRQTLMELPRWTPTRLMEPPGSPVRAAYAAGVAETVAVLEEIVADGHRRGAYGGDDGILGALLAANRRGEMDADEVTSTLFILLLTGYDPMITFVTSALVALWQRPRLLAALRADPGRVPAATGELLRYLTPLTAPMVRHFTEPVEAFGVRVPAGEPVLPHLALANRDPRRFGLPNRLDLGRPVRGDLVFARGAHYCPGAALATAQCRIALGVLLRRLPGLTAAVPAAEYRWRPGATGSAVTHLHVVSGLEALPVACGVEAR